MEQRESHEMDSMLQESSRQNSPTSKLPDTAHERMQRSRASSLAIREPAVRSLTTPTWPIITFALYATLVVFTWTIACLGNFGLIGTNKSYMDIRDLEEDDLNKALKRHEKVIRVAYILQVVTAILTIPITSSIRSATIAAFIQAGNLRTILNLQQTMALADQGWLSPRIWTHVSCTSFQMFNTGWLLGNAFQIFQQAIVQVVPVQFPTKGTSFRMSDIPDVPGLVNARTPPPESENTNIFRLRSSLKTLYEHDYEPLLWAPESFIMSQCERYSLDPTCHGLNMPETFGWLKSLLSRGGNVSVPWLAPLPSHFNIGVYEKPQYVPRINTTIAYTNFAAADWPRECERRGSGVFFAEYYHQLDDDDYFNTGVVVCMTKNITESPWKATHNRQDITENFYLNITTRGMASRYGTTFYKATAESSPGYFELPSLHNGNQPGPLLSELRMEDPVEEWSSGSSSPEAKRAANVAYPGDVLQPVGNNLGPLTTLGLALFGEGSLVDTSLTNLSSYIPNRPIDPQTLEYRFTGPLNSGNRVFLSPVIFFGGSYDGLCIRDWDLNYQSSVISMVDEFLDALGDLAETHKAFTMVAYLANKVWLSGMNADRSLSLRSTRTLEVDPGVKTIKINLSAVKIIVGSLLVGAHLLGLLTLVIYSVLKQTFVSWLGSEVKVMVKAGTAYAEILSAAEGDKQWKENAAACAGFIGDKKPDENPGRMAFGAVTGLKTRSLRKYEDL